MAKRRKRTNNNVPAKGVLRDMADALWSRAVRADWAWKCAVCGAEKIDAHHLIPRQWEATRYDMRNGIGLCSSHHQFDPDISPHQNAMGWLAWLETHQPRIIRWYDTTMADGLHRHFDGTKNAAYYCDQIRRLKQYVEPEDYTRIVGVKFSQWLEANK